MAGYQVHTKAFYHFPSSVGQGQANKIKNAQVSEVKGSLIEKIKGHMWKQRKTKTSHQQVMPSHFLGSGASVHIANNECVP